MRIVVTSDTHRASRDFFNIIERHEKNADLFINLGDSEKEMETLAMLKPKLNIKCVCGNCDWSSTAPIDQIITFNGKRVFFTHGHKYHVKYGYAELEARAREVGADICLFGHTHEAYTEIKDGIYYLNPGAVCHGSYGIVDVVPGGIMMYTNTI